MRWLIPILALSFAGCGSKDNGNSANDMSVAAAPDMPLSLCDVIKQDCGAGQKCVPNLSGSTVLASGSCVSNGTVTEGQPCVPDYIATAVANDNCTAGLLCDNDGPDNAYVCRKLCAGDASCSVAGQKCAGLFNPIPWGLCLPTCTLFGIDCPNGNSCAVSYGTIDANSANGLFVCKASGTASAFDSCMTDTDCGDNLICDNSRNWCTPVCDNNHLCNLQPSSDDAGASITVSCKPFPNLVNGQGYCG